MKEHKLRTLNPRQQCRDKLHMFFGSNSNFYHPIQEVVQNAIDEISNNFEHGDATIELLDDDKTIRITDTGRGMPLCEIDEETNTPYWELLFRTLFSSSKYDNIESEEETGGTNGVGNTVICYTSDFFRCDAFYKGTHWMIEFEDGGEIKTPLTNLGPTDKHGTIITFKLSDEVYTDTTFEAFEVREKIRRFSATADKVSLHFKYKDTQEDFHYDNISDYFDDITNNLTSKKFVGYEKTYDYDNEKNTLSVVLATSSEPVQEVFLNYNYLKLGGSINNFIIRGVRNYLNKHLKNNKDNTKLTDKDVADSLSFCCNFKSTNVSFESQTKFSTNKKVYERVAKEYAEEIMEVMLIENKPTFEKMLKHIKEIKKFNEKSTANVRKLKKTLTEKIDTVLNKVAFLDDCKIHGEEAELFICEGLSAKGSISLSRDAKFQAVIAMKGKVMNCLKADYSTIFKSTTIVNLIKVLGCGIATDKNYKDLGSFDIKRLRYGKILLACDADPDGLQIVCLLLTLFYRLMPELLHQGRVYIVKTPLYENKLSGDDVIYTFTEEEQKEVIAKRGQEIKNVARAKGLGELDAEYMAKVGVDPETRFVERVTVGSVEKMKDAFDNWMGPSPQYRKQYLNSHLKDYLSEV